MKKILAALFLLCLSVLLIPTAVVPLASWMDKSPDAAEPAAPEQGDAVTAGRFSDPYEITLYRTGTGEILTLHFEDYIAGMVAGEMPPTNHPEALRAQAVAARSYMLSKIAEYLESGIPEEHHGALLCDGFSHCKSWCPLQETEARWDSRFAQDYAEKVTAAVQDTRGEYLAYQGKVAKAFFFAVSSGRTENAADVWGVALPYLQSVSSEEDRRADGYRSRIFYPLEAFYTVLKGARPGFQPPAAPEGLLGEVRTAESGGVLTAEIGGETFTGLELQRLFDLRSICFTLSFQEGQAVFDVKGYGHGVGMSQFGANAMAQAGCGYQEILHHYYTDVTLAQLYQIA